MKNFNRNNLDQSSSPYLLQHAGNPVWWQEWGSDVLEYAGLGNKPLLVSSGYSTCHWCHVMAAGAFSDKETAAFLNDHFVCIKIDREQRPDIDQFLMHFIQAQNGSGGWPLNVFLTPRGNPFFAMTYAPVASAGRSLSFLEIALQIRDYFGKHGHGVQPFTLAEHVPEETDEDELINNLASFYDDVSGGFGHGQKFPPHSTLLFLLYRLSFEEDHLTKVMCIQTLDAMLLRGLHDHLQGGIFRYCTDRNWTIPHFEKMLYDQAMALWVFSLAYKVLRKEAYRQTADKILTCLSDCFEEDGLYITAWDADTDHEEGATYLWSYEDLAEVLTPDEFRALKEVYQISEAGNFEGKNHLIRKNDRPLDEIEKKLLAIRKSRPQPFRDSKILSGLNALTAVSLIQAGRLLDRPEPEAKGAAIVNKLIDIYWDGSVLGHSVFNGQVQQQSFLSDAAALLLAVTHLHETDPSWGSLMEILVRYVETFIEDGVLIESKAEDFRPVAASWFDHPSPSGVSLAEMALTRAGILSGKDYPPSSYRRPFMSDFYNISVMIRNGEFHVYTSEKPVPWKSLPGNSIQKRGTPETECYRGVCQSPVSSVSAFVSAPCPLPHAFNCDSSYPP